MIRHLLVVCVCLASCGSEPRGIVISDSGPYEEAQIFRVTDYTFELVDEVFHGARQRIESNNLTEISVAENLKCGSIGHANGCHRKLGEAYDSVEFEPVYTQPICTTLAHELLHLVEWEYDIPGNHEDPRLWRRTGGDGSLESRIQVLGMKREGISECLTKLP